MIDKTRTLREVFVAIASILAAAAAVWACVEGQILWALMPVPAAVGLAYHFLNLSSRFLSRRTVVEEYRTFTESFDRTWSRSNNPARVSEDLADDLDAHAPTLAGMIWAASLLMIVFAIPAVVSHGGLLLLSSAPKLDESLRAVVFSGLGVWVVIVFRTIGRVNAGGLNARFLVTAALRAGVAMMLGYFAGAANYFKDVQIAGSTAYFLVGLTYALFYDSLVDKAYKLFGREKPVTKELPLKMVEGIDDDAADILAELNIASVQHLATSDPGVLTVRSLYPFGRVVDFIDQAILIVYFGENIVTLRNFGVRGVIDFVSMLEQVIDNTPNRASAEKTLNDIAAKLSLSYDALYILGLSIYYDYRVNLLTRLWQHTLQAEGYMVERAQAAAAAAADRIPIRTSSDQATSPA